MFGEPQTLLQPRTLSEAAWPRSMRPRAALLRDAGLIVAFSLFVALCARISIALPFTPVPITGQTLAVLLTGAALGSRRGALALLLYLAEGAAGLPVFANGAAGAGWIIGPTGGFLLSFPVAAFVTGALAERGWDRSLPGAALAMLLGNVLIYLIGLPWLGIYKDILFKTSLLQAGLFPFVIGDLLKIAVAALVLPSAWRLVGMRRR
ncbi:MAG: biotin biosynthesis protein BioY [Herpetosiphonaceae bacterium]|nr:MAG: biotin biosynthesis protein BioY [Herpetosiphonaceae bacterium]